MTSTLSVNSDNDIFAVNGVLQVATGLTAVLQTCERVVKVIIGEIPFNTTLGIDYLNDAFGDVNVIKFAASARVQINRVSNVTSISNFETTVSGGVLSYTATIATTFGTGAISG